MQKNKGKRRHIHVDLVGGLAGDMFVAAALDAGLVQEEALVRELRKVGLGPVEMISEVAIRGAIEGRRIRFAGWDEEHEADHRHLSTIRMMLAKSALSEPVKVRATRLFERLGAAEAAVHGMELEEVHFHEVGAVDSILDFVAAAWIIEEAVASWSVGVIPLGRGTIETAHGTIPVPAPATARVLQGMEVVMRDVEAELVTPTGATIAAELKEIGGIRRGKVVGSGFGCGTRELEGVSNVVRLMIMEEDRGSASLEEVVQLSCEIDDQTAEILANVAESLMNQGALDVVREAVQMKKGRLATGLRVLCRVKDEEAMVEAIFEETTTFGVRRQVVERWVLEREMISVETEFGPIRVKVGTRRGKVVQISPEFEDCLARAKASGVEVRRVMEAAALASQALGRR